jgi:AcrR family transcriptional regulator
MINNLTLSSSIVSVFTDHTLKPTEMKASKQSYHHGDLKLTLINAAIKMLQTSGLGGLSMRKLADETGVSRSAPYHHFCDKQALLCAIAEDGFQQQDRLLEDLINSADGQNQQQVFEKFVIAYVHFAAQNPQQYDLMYGSDIWRSGKPTEALEQAARTSFKRWVNEISRLQSQGILQQNVTPLRLSQVAWATLHGLCRLLNDGIYVDKKDIDEMARTAIELLLNKSG